MDRREFYSHAIMQEEEPRDAQLPLATRQRARAQPSRS